MTKQAHHVPSLPVSRQKGLFSPLGLEPGLSLSLSRYQMQRGSLLPEALAAGFRKLDFLRCREQHRILGVCEPGGQEPAFPEGGQRG